MKHLLQHFNELSLHPKNAKALKGLILQLAIQGKLTENWRAEHPDVESSKTLIGKIEKSRIELISKGKIKDYGTYEYIDKGLQKYTIPESWLWCKLSNLTDLPYGKGLSKKELVDEGFKVFGANGVIGKYSSYLYEESMLLISCRGAYSGKPNISPEKCYVTSNSLVCEFYLNDEILRDFFFHVIDAVPKEHIVSGSAQPQVTATNARELIVPLPPLQEQKAIVDIVEELFAEVEQLEKKTVQRIQLKQDYVTSALQNLAQANDVVKAWQTLQPQFKTFFDEKANIKSLRESILQLAVQGKLTAHWRKQRRLSGAEAEPASELLKRIQSEKQKLIEAKKIRKGKAYDSIKEIELSFELPETWVWCRLVDLTILITDGKHGNCKDEINSGYYFLSAKDVKKGRLSYENARQINYEEFNEVHQRTNLEAGDLCIVNTGATVGKSAIVEDNDYTRKTTFQKSVAVVKVIHEYIDINYLDNFIKNQTPQLLKKSGGSAINNLLLDDMRKIITPLPPLEEQKAIVQIVDELMAYCDTLERELEQRDVLIEDLMASCLHGVFN